MTIAKSIYNFKAMKFVKHVQLFMESLQLIGNDKLVLVAVSGGMDSVALLYVLASIFQGRLKVLHFNHGARTESIEEEKLVIRHCQFLKLEVDIIRFDLNLKLANFESIARNLRNEVYQQYIQKNYWVYTGHHLDDSFEWSMIQSFRQSSLSSTLGIPVFNKGIVRPFMCASKKQIRFFAKTMNLDWAEDSSNHDCRFERNFFRAKITDSILKRYPQYLCHYVARQNILALELKLHRSLFLKNQNDQDLTVEEKLEASGAVVLRSRDFTLHKNQIIKWIHYFSESHRGEINNEVDKLILAHKKISDDPKLLKLKGPLSFSGGVKIFILDEYLFICNDVQLAFYQKWDEQILQSLVSPFRETQIPELASKNLKPIFFPYLCYLQPQKYNHSSKLIHPLLPKSTEWLKYNKIPYDFYPVIIKKGTEKLIHTAVILDSSLLGL